MAENKAELGSTAKTNELLAQASKKTGVEAPVFNEETGAKVESGNISAPGVENAKRFNIPTAPTPVVASRIVDSTPIPPVPVEKPLDQQASTQAQDLRKSISDRQSILEELGLGDIKDSFEQLMQKGQFTQQAEAEAGIGSKTTALNEINSQIRETDLRFRRNIERIEDEPGLTRAQKGARINEVNRKQARELADLSIISATRRDDLVTAQALVDRKVELTFEPIEQKLQFQQMIYNENKDLFNKAEQRQFEIKMRDEQIQIDKDKVKFSMAENLKAQYVMNAAQAGKSNEYLQAIQRAEGQEELFAIPGIQNYSMSQAEKLDQQLRRMSITKASIDIDNARATKAALVEAKQKGLLSNDQLKDATDLRKEYNNLQEVKDAKKLEPDTLSLLSALNQKNGVGDIAAINSFQRLAVDPGVAVREGDVALLQSAQSFGDKSYLKAQGLFKGDKLTDEARTQMINLVEDIYEARVEFVEENTAPIRTTADQSGIDFNTYIGRDFSSYETIANKASTGGKQAELSSYVDSVVEQSDTFSNWLSDFTLNKN